MAEETVDHEARKMALLASQRITDHEDRCGERWADQRAVMERLINSMVAGFAEANRTRRELHTRINAIIFLALVTALGGAGWLITQVLERG